jgi:hypothetical protein
MNGVPTDGFKSGPTNEFQGCLCRNDINMMPVFYELANNRNCLIRSNAAGDTDDNAKLRVRHEVSIQ